MTDRQRVRELFAQASELPEERRADFLATACGGDHELLSELQALLAAHESAGPLDTPAPGAAPGWSSRAAAEDPEEIGRYRVLEVLGEGGMGTVYLAEQREPVRRRVALKVIKLGMDSKQVLARFESESQALAMMDHENIARFYDAGITERGQSYFVMEYVAGETITEYCARRRLTPRQRVELFGQICAGVQHAHLKGVIHRDLKPSNVLIKMQGDTAIPKIIDFGLARAANYALAQHTVHTRFGQFVGTPEYMSPEQAGQGRDIDSRTDIYSLGVLLYELLVGTTPLDGEDLRELSYSEVLRRIQEYEPLRPSSRVSEIDVPAACLPASPRREARASTPGRNPARQLRRQLKGDLDWITMKALAKSPADRYQTALELLQDLGRHLREEPILASPPSLRYRLRKFSRRHRTRLGVAAVSLTIVLSAVAASIPYLRQMEADRRIAAEEARQGAVEDLRAQLAAAESAEQGLFPVHPSRIRAMREWLRRHVDPLIEGTPSHRELGEPALVDRLLALQQRAEVVRAEMQWAAKVESVTISEQAATWRRAIAAIAASDGVRSSRRYRFLKIEPQLGLVPLGMDPRTRLWEFYHPRSAEDRDAVPTRRPDGTSTGLSGLVFVLMPPGTFRMGAQARDPHGFNYHAAAAPDEAPVREVQLRAFFVAKHRLTPAQWRRLASVESTTPGTSRAGVPVEAAAGRAAPRLVTADAGMASWTEATQVLGRHGLALPTEAQWEYARRPPTDHPTGLDELEPGLWEWCRDRYAEYTRGLRIDDGLRLADGAKRALRGGVRERLAARRAGAAESLGGIRPVRPLTGPGPFERRFDFGCHPEGTLPSAVEQGWVRVLADTHYTPDRGFGWTEGTNLKQRDRAGPDDLLRDFVFGGRPAAFRVDLPNGLYEVELTSGDCFRNDRDLVVSTQGRHRFRMWHDKCQFVTARFGVEVTAGRLDLGFTEEQESNWSINALRIVATPEASWVERPRFSSWSVDTSRRSPVERDEPARSGAGLAIKPPRVAGVDFPSSADYMRVLERFPYQAERLWKRIGTHSGEPIGGWFGTRQKSGPRAMLQTACTLFTYALLAGDPSYDPGPSGVQRSHLLRRARQGLRFLTWSHQSGSSGGTEPPWGSVIDAKHGPRIASRLAAAAQRIWDDLGKEERLAVHRVLRAEADHLQTLGLQRHRPINSFSYEHVSRGELFAWAGSMFPDDPAAAVWGEQARRMFMNTLSVAADRSDDRLVDGRPIRDQFEVASVRSDFTMHRFGTYQLGYLLYALGHLAGGNWAFASQGHPAPEATLHHFDDAWKTVVRPSFLYDNRLACVSGKLWPRYIWGPYLIMPALVLLQIELGDKDARLLEGARFRRLEQEQVLNGDGRFFGLRSRTASPSLVARMHEYDAECYASLGLAYLLHERKPDRVDPSTPADFQRSVQRTWRSRPARFVMSRSPRAFASFSWRSFGKGGDGLGLFVPAGADDLVDWGRDQLVGRLRVQGFRDEARLIDHQERLYEDGFTTTGRYYECLSRERSPAVEHFVGIAGLPEDGMMVVFDRPVALQDILVTREAGLCLSVANDIFNGNRRTLHYDRGSLVLEGTSEVVSEVFHTLDSRWLNIDGVLGVVQISPGRPFVVLDRSQRNNDCLLTELICCPRSDEPRRVGTATAVRETAIVLTDGNRRQTAELAARSWHFNDKPGVQVVLLVGSRGPILVAACLQNEAAEVEVVLPDIGGKPPRFPDLMIGSGRIRLRLDPMSTEVWRPR